MDSWLFVNFICDFFYLCICPIFSTWILYKIWNFWNTFVSMDIQSPTLSASTHRHSYLNMSTLLCYNFYILSNFSLLWNTTLKLKTTKIEKPMGFSSLTVEKLERPEYLLFIWMLNNESVLKSTSTGGNSFHMLFPVTNVQWGLLRLCSVYWYHWLYYIISLKLSWKSKLFIELSL